MEINGPEDVQAALAAIIAWAQSANGSDLDAPSRITLGNLCGQEGTTFDAAKAAVQSLAS